MPYEEQFEKVQQAILKEMETIPEILAQPAPAVHIQEFDSHSIKIGVFAYVKPEDYWTVYYNSTLSIKQALGKNGVKMAYSEGVELGPIGDK
jgi:small conductance mechanosensitive channel